jgi:predicted dienelactone hydrolase
VEVIELVVKDAARGRAIPLRVFLPDGPAAAPVVLFSHGLGGSCEGSNYLGRHWGARGLVGVFLQHPGSDTGVWRDAAPGARRKALEEAASSANFLLRIKDVPAVLDELARWNQQPGHPLAGRLDLTKVGMSGHSFGAVTTQALSGQRAARGGLLAPDPRIAAAVAMSPSSPVLGTPEHAFGGVAIPWMLLTGTRDTAPLGNADVASRLAVFAALPPGGKYQLVLNDAEHSAFTDHPLPGDTAPRNPNHHRLILAVTTAFWDAWLRDDPAARAWLAGNSPQLLMQPGDSWKSK